MPIPTAIAAMPFAWFDFEKTPNGAGHVTALKTLAGKPGITDLIVIAHGWKTDEAGAWALYEKLLANTAAVLPADGAGFAVAGITWRSKQFDPGPDAPLVEAGGAVAVGEDVGIEDMSRDDLMAAVDGFLALWDGESPDLRAAAEALATEEDVRGDGAIDLVVALRDLMAAEAPDDDTEMQPERVDLSGTPGDVLTQLLTPATIQPDQFTGTAAGLGEFIGKVTQGPRAAAARLLNQLTYFTMKKRAGEVGVQLGRALGEAFGAASGPRIHLIGHSFGARLVTAAAASCAPLKPRSLILLQGAYSHNGLSPSIPGKGPGAFAAVKPGAVISGAIVISHTHNDSACTVAYPLASRASLTIASSLGGPDDLFGAMGANGARFLAPDPQTRVMTQGGAYSFSPGLVFNVRGDACISEHMDVDNPDVGRLVAAAVQV